MVVSTEYDLVDTPFMSRTNKAIKAPIVHDDYEQSQRLVIKFIRRRNIKMKKTYDPDELVTLKLQINKLKAIEKDLQKAMETY
jgi:hypothetical protein